MTDRKSGERPAREPSALEINLRRTASRVVIPETQKVLLDATRESVGVHEKTRLLLEEFNHPFVNWSHVLTELRSYAVGNFYFHNAYERGDEAIRVLVEIFFSVGEQCVTPDLRIETYRALLRYLEKVVEGSNGRLERNRPVLEATFRGLLDRFHAIPGLAGVLSGSVRRVLRAAGENDPGWARPLLLDLMKTALGETYRIWLELPDPADWVDSGAPDTLPSLGRIRHDAIRGYQERLNTIAADAFDEMVLDTGSLPDQAVMENLYLHAADEIESHFEGWSGYTNKVLFLLKILDSELLRQIRDPALRAINRALSRALRMEERPHAAGFIDAVFDSFGRGWLLHDTTVLDCIHTIAVDVLRSEDDRLIQKVIDRILDHGFETPELQGVNELWQFEVNPAHAKNIRLWLELISLNPGRMKRLLSALIFHLRMGGVFISDTDLFQKDVAGLLNADIRPVYNLVKQLGKFFPIYFREIGAEGELRRVSTRVDEIGLRRDSVIHFLRKQCHVESSSRLIPFAVEVLRYWSTGDAEPLRAHLPEEIFPRLADEKEHLEYMRPVIARVVERVESFPSGLLDRKPEEIREWVEAGPEPTEGAREKAIQMIRVYQLLDRKYNIGPRGALDGLEGSSLVEGEAVRRLAAAMEEDRPLDAVAELVDILERLKEIILDPEPAESREDIYRKRHIAAGIPSMYGRFLNRKVEALGISYRLEKLAEVLFERLIEDENLRYLTKRGIARVTQWLVLLRRSLWVDGISSRGLGSRIDMLERGLDLGNLTIDQFINIFQFTSRTIREITRYTIASLNESDLERLAPLYVEGGPPKADRGRVHMKIEAFLRDQISSCFALQPLDNLVSRVLSTLTFESEAFGKSTRNLLMSYDIDKCFVPIHTDDKASGDPILLGFKGSFLRRMAGFGYPVPAGFIVTTEVYRTYEALSAFKDLRAHTLSVLRNRLREIERRTGRTFGDPQNPLLLSVRSGAAVSMPGMMDTFLDVGINQSIAEGLASDPRFAWAAWDSYRRFLQSWGLSYGVPQEIFDRIFEDYKNRWSVQKKASFTAEQIREVALACRRAISDHDVEIVDEPFRQLRHCIERVLFSWDSERARHYRKEMKIADDWGTAVVVQAMVYGNLDEQSGTGVLFTQNPRRKSGGVSLYGDFVLRSQGEDVVRGLVETYPLTEEQRQTQKRADISLESEFPEVYRELLRIAEDLVVVRGFNHQELEFTFEKDDASSLYILQARDIVTPEESEIPTFVSTPELDEKYITSGIGVGGGALSGRVAHNERDIRELWEKDPDGTIILVRPNTVPEDIHMIFRADGLLTSRGGATSHAAVAAQSIGRTCVVGCRALHVDERAGRTVIGDKVIRSGDFISINGYNGAVYLGEHEIKPVVRFDNL
ncbi:MAG: hypothetical protein JW958_13910 [Candidatus Eisenbacteria bacterium]|nr:hypothetical protein [Candidatus Eisenbacteria bacterium]